MLLEEAGPGYQITPSAYDTAWIARLHEIGEPIADEALEWLRRHQLADGSWGAAEPVYYHDRLICTLAAVIALSKRGQPEDTTRIERGVAILDRLRNQLYLDPAGETIAFEMLVPTLMAEAKTLGIIGRGDTAILNYLQNTRTMKLAKIPDHMINRSVTMAHSIEMVGETGLHLLNLDNLQEANGSVGYSPAATAFFALYVQRGDPAALSFIRRAATQGAVPYVAPIDAFERAWTLWNLALIDSHVLSWRGARERHLDFLETHWQPGIGLPSCTGLSYIDGDATSVVNEVLSRFKRPVDLDAIMRYEDETHFRCYPLEANPSISTNIHILSALRQAGLDKSHPSVQKIRRFLGETRLEQRYWLDKWHASPYYPTAHALIATVNYDQALAAGAADWLLKTQNEDGSWGYYMPTAEETAYALQALAVWHRAGFSVPKETLRRGAAWLGEHRFEPYPMLWIGKCLYTPTLVVRSAVLSALIMVEQL